MLATRRILPTWPNSWIVFQICTSRSGRESENSAANLEHHESFSTNTRIESCSEPTQCRVVTTHHSRSSGRHSTKSIIVFLKRKTSTSITHQHQNRRRDVGAFTE